jgi:hypothetical protein
MICTIVSRFLFSVVGLLFGVDKHATIHDDARGF